MYITLALTLNPLGLLLTAFSGFATCVVYLLRNKLALPYRDSCHNPMGFVIYYDFDMTIVMLCMHTELLTKQLAMMKCLLKVKGHVNL